MKRRFAVLFLCAVLILSCIALTACVRESPGVTETDSGAQIKCMLNGGKTEDLLIGLEKSEVSLEAPDSAFALSAMDFSIELFKTQFKADANTLISPLSVLTALAMTRNGAGGSTLSQMDAVLGGRAQQTNGLLGGCLQRLSQSESAEFNFANSIWFRDDGLEVNEDFLQKNAAFFNAQAFAADFSGKTAVNDINAWVKRETGGTIDNVLDGIPKRTVAFIINALCFEAEWETPYERNSVGQGDFTAFDGKKIKVDYMHSREHKYIKMNDATGFLKLYEGGGYAFAALLPNEGVELEAFVNGLDGSDFINAVSGAQERTVVTCTPKFETEFSNELSDGMKAMGLRDAFDENLADFSNMAVSSAGNIFISKIIHKTYIEVNELGTRAGAVTVVTMADSAMPVEPPPEVLLTRPFVYAIIDMQTSMPIFIGALTAV